MLLSRNDWRKFKEKYGVPDAICSFSMGEKLEAWKKKDEAAQNAKDFKARVVAVDTLLKDMKAYQAALGKTKSAKFKGKNPAEQAKMNSDTKIKVVLEAYEKGKEIWAGCQLALTGLAFAIGAN